MDKKAFVTKKFTEIIERMSGTTAMYIADALFEKQFINRGTYEMIDKQPFEEKQVRELLRALRSPESYSVFCQSLGKTDIHLWQYLESKQCDETDFGLSAKRPRIENPQAEESDKENRNETYSGTNFNFESCTLSKLHEHVEDPTNVESMVTSLGQRLEEGQMKQVESWLQERVPKTTVVFDHKNFRDVCINRDLKTFLDSKKDAKFPKKVFDQFFKKRGPTGTKSESSGTWEESFQQNSVNHTNSCAHMPYSPEVHDMTADAIGSIPNNVSPKKRQNRQVHDKTKQERDILLQYLMKQIPSEKLGTYQEAEELKKIKACVTTVIVREHPLYPLLMVYNCRVFRDPRTNQKKLIEIVDSTARGKAPFDFKVQFQMWVLGLPEAVVLSKTGEEVFYVKSFENEVKQFQRYLHEAVVPALAFYKKLENLKFLHF